MNRTTRLPPSPAHPCARRAASTQPVQWAWQRACALAAAAALLSTLAPSAAWADDGERIASEQGCLNCHTSTSRTSPTLGQLADKLKRKGDPADTLQHMLDEIREHDAVHSHRRVSDEAALAVLRWLAQPPK